MCIRDSPPADPSRNLFSETGSCGRVGRVPREGSPWPGAARARERRRSRGGARGPGAATRAAAGEGKGVRAATSHQVSPREE
eukprot:11096506-Alexandrium_andersonii.AAC.1